MRLLKVWDSEYPWDVRAEKVMRSLSGNGFDVHLVARNRRGDEIREERPEATVHRLRPWHWAGKTVDAASQFPAFMNPRWIRHIHRTARLSGARLILVRDLPLAPSAVWVGRWMRIPVVLDMAENYPAMIRDIWDAGRQGPLDAVVRNPSAVAAIERWVVRAVDHVLVVVEESGRRLERLGLDPARITVVCNTPWPSRIPKETSVRSSFDGPLRLVYLGLLETPRGLDTVLRAAAHLRQMGIAVHLDIVGGGREAEHFRAEAARLGIPEDAACFHGVLPYEQALDRVRGADIGLVPHLAVESWNTTIPNKLFDYMSNGLPVVTSDAAPAERIVKSERCGEVFRSADHEDLAAAISRLLSPEVRRRMGENGREAVRTRYNWSVDEARLLGAIRGALTGGRLR